MSCEVVIGEIPKTITDNKPKQYFCRVTFIGSEEECNEFGMSIFKKEEKRNIRSEVKLGAPITCPVCKTLNPSGTSVPDDCRYCCKRKWGKLL